MSTRTQSVSPCITLSHPKMSSFTTRTCSYLEVSSYTTRSHPEVSSFTTRSHPEVRSFTTRSHPEVRSFTTRSHRDTVPLPAAVVMLHVACIILLYSGINELMRWFHSPSINGGVPQSLSTSLSGGGGARQSHSTSSSPRDAAAAQ